MYNIKFELPLPRTQDNKETQIYTTTNTDIKAKSIPIWYLVPNHPNNDLIDTITYLLELSECTDLPL